MTYYVYILKCSDQTLYTGITTNPKRRVDEHNNSNKLGAKYTRTRRPVKIVYIKKYKTRSEAAKEEIQMKKLSRKQKELLIE